VTKCRTIGSPRTHEQEKRHRQLQPEGLKRNDKIRRGEISKMKAMSGGVLEMLLGLKREKATG